MPATRQTKSQRLDRQKNWDLDSRYARSALKPIEVQSSRFICNLMVFVMVIVMELMILRMLIAMMAT